MLDMSVGKILLALVNAALAVAGGWWCRSIFQAEEGEKASLVVTMRVKRTYIVMGVVYTLLCTPIALLTKVYFCGYCRCCCRSGWRWVDCWRGRLRSS